MRDLSFILSAIIVLQNDWMAAEKTKNKCWIRLVNWKWDGDYFFSLKISVMKAIDFEKSALEHGLAIGSKKDFFGLKVLTTVSGVCFCPNLQ